jgi:Bacterial membrane protein YfhO
VTILDQQDTSQATAPAAAEGARRAGRRRSPMARLQHPDWVKLAPLLLVALAVGFNLFVLRTELTRVADVNDTSVHVSMVRWAQHRIESGQLVFDGWYPRLALGLPQFHHYQSLPHIIGGAFATIFGAERTVTWTYYLGLSLWPICMFVTMRLFRFDRWTAGCTALLAPMISSVTLYGYEHGSYVWQGNGVWSQLWGMWLFPLALALSWRAVSRGKGYAIAALAVGLTIACHFLTGYLALLSLGIWVVIVPSQFLKRLARAAVVGIGGALAAAWVVVPLLVDSKYAARTEYNVGTFWADSHGGEQVMKWLFTGELFDHGRWAVLSVLVGIGAVLCVARFLKDERARALLVFTAVGLLLFCGRDTIGFAIDLMPGGKDLLLHRFIIPVHLGGLMLAGIAAGWLVRHAYVAITGWQPKWSHALVGAGMLVVGIVVLIPVWRERAGYDAQSANWINVQRQADSTSGASFTALADEAASRGGGRVFAGSAATSSDEAVGYVSGYTYLLNDDVDGIGFTLRTLSLSDDVETRFDASNPAHYDLYNVRWVILPEGQKPAVKATKIDTRGEWALWEVPTSGYLRVVDTTPAIVADRTNLGQRVNDFLASSAPADGKIPVIAFGGDRAAAPTEGFDQTATGSPGDVDVQFERPDDGVFGGTVTASRAAVVMLKATYHPRWTVTVDGRPAKTEMIAPSFVGVRVPAGEHTVEFKYEPYPDYWLLFLIGILTLVALAVVPRWWARRRAGRSGTDPDAAADANAGPGSDEGAPRSALPGDGGVPAPVGP